MRALLALLLLVASPALAHAGEHGLHLGEVRVALAPLGPVVSFVVANAPDAATRDLRAFVSFADTFREERALDELAAGESRAFSLQLPVRPPVSTCVMVGAAGKVSDTVCVLLPTAG